MAISNHQRPAALLGFYEAPCESIFQKFKRNEISWKIWRKWDQPRPSTINSSKVTILRRKKNSKSKFANLHIREVQFSNPSSTMCYQDFFNINSSIQVFICFLRRYLKKKGLPDHLRGSLVGSLLAGRPASCASISRFMGMLNLKFKTN
jgi:hypothetical protein